MKCHETNFGNGVYVPFFTAATFFVAIALYSQINPLIAYGVITYCRFLYTVARPTNRTNCPAPRRAVFNLRRTATLCLGAHVAKAEAVDIQSASNRLSLFRGRSCRQNRGAPCPTSICAAPAVDETATLCLRGPV